MLRLHFSVTTLDLEGLKIVKKNRIKNRCHYEQEALASSNLQLIMTITQSHDIIISGQIAIASMLQNQLH